MPILATVVVSIVSVVTPAFGASSGDQLETARIYLGSRDSQALESFARAVSDVNSPDYRHFLTPAQYHARFALTAEQHRSIRSRLTQAGLRVTGDTAHYLEFTGSADAVRAVSGGGGRAKAAVAGTVGVEALAAATAAAPLSARVAADDESVTTCSSYFGQKPAADLPPAYGATSTFATCPYRPAQLRRAYRAGTSGATGKGRTVAIVAAYGSATMPADADRFATAVGDHPFRASQYGQQVTPADWNLTDDCATPADWAGEQALDVETAHGYAPDADVLYVGANSCLDYDLMAAEAAIIDTHAADIVSNSWAEIIHADPGHLTPGLIDAWNLLFEQAVVEGIGVYFASGDCGDASPAAAASGFNCDATTTGAQAEFPGSSPWVTSVGGTALRTDDHGAYAGETSMGTALSIVPAGTRTWTPLPGLFVFGGGGGPGDFARPWYQRGRVPDVDGTTRRVTPDVSLEGDFALPVLIGYTVDGRYQQVGFAGTSAAAPGIAAIQADAEQTSGHVIGFANPMLYALQRAGVFHDVGATDPSRPPTVVRDLGEEQGDLRYVLLTLGQDFGLPAAAGYDTATGLGTPGRSYLSWFRTHRRGFAS